MKKIITISLILAVFVLIVGQGCIKDTKPSNQNKQETTAQETQTGTAQENINDIENRISDIGSIDTELNISDLDNLSNELDEVNW